MNKKIAHFTLFFGDVFSIWGLWIGCQEFQRIFSEIAIGADLIRFGNRVGFLVLGLFLPPLHLLTIIEYFCSEFVLSAGIIGSSWIKYKVETAGYAYCRELSGVSALFRSLVYTKDMAICEDLVAAKFNQHTK